MKISLIVAVDKENGIGKNNDLPWHLPADMKFFKETTTGNIVLMGRKNYESIPLKFRPLPNRLNLILTRDYSFTAENCILFHSIEELLQWKDENEKDPRVLYITGGGEIFKQLLDLRIVEEMFITHIDHSFDADVFFPSFNEKEWTKEIVFSQEIDEKNNYAFKTYKYSYCYL